MANVKRTSRRTTKEVPVQRKKSPKSVRFVAWGTSFFDHLENICARRNQGLLELVYSLGERGRQELALSIYNFLRNNLWREFILERQHARKVTEKRLRDAISKSRKAAASHRCLLKAFPEISLLRELGEAPFSDICTLLEIEAEYLAGQTRLIDHAGRTGIRCDSGDSRMKDRALSKLLHKAVRDLSRAAQSWKHVFSLQHSPHSWFPPISPNNLPHRLEGEIDQLRFVLGRTDAFNKKRFGTKHCIGILVRLQDLIAEFRERRPDLPNSIPKQLTENDLADLLEAGDAAFEREPTFIEAASIGRAIERMRNRNPRFCERLKANAQYNCDRILADNPPAAR